MRSVMPKPSMIKIEIDKIDVRQITNDYHERIKEKTIWFVTSFLILRLMLYLPVRKTSAENEKTLMGYLKLLLHLLVYFHPQHHSQQIERV